jgi:predicted metal-dependent hydrolase
MYNALLVSIMAKALPTIIRSKRKTFALEVKRDGSLVVRAPLRATRAQVEALVSQKSDWIKSKQELVKSLYPPAPPREYVNGEGFLYLGQSYQLAMVDGAAEPLVLSDQFNLARPALPDAQAVFKAWYRQQAFDVISRRVEWYASLNGFVYQQVKISNARMRWGSCSPTGALSFSWRLVMAPLRVIDYVVVHELVHLQVKNHSRDFWGKVKTHMPDYREQVAWLKQNGYRLTLSQ